MQKQYKCAMYKSGAMERCWWWFFFTFERLNRIMFIIHKYTFGENDSILPFSVEIQGKPGGETIDCINIGIVLKRKQLPRFLIFCRFCAEKKQLSHFSRFCRFCAEKKTIVTFSTVFVVSFLKRKQLLHFYHFLLFLILTLIAFL